MKKLSLDVEQLRVESYDTTAGNTSGRGTVWGNSANLTYTMDFTCPGSACGSPSNAPRCAGGVGGEVEPNDPGTA